MSFDASPTTTQWTVPLAVDEHADLAAGGEARVDQGPGQLRGRQAVEGDAPSIEALEGFRLGRAEPVGVPVDLQTVL